VQAPKLDGLTADQVWSLVNCRGLKQFKDGLEGYRTGKCLFCDPLSEKNVVMYDNGVHRCWHNPYALKHTKLHIIIAPVLHVLGTDPRVFTREYRASVSDVIVWAAETFPEIKTLGGGEVKRFGTMEHNAGTIQHDHTNLIVTDLTGEVRMTIAKEPGEIAEAIRRFEIYLKLYNGATPEQLTPEEFELVKKRL
jgi:hypothetical protein